MQFYIPPYKLDKFKFVLNNANLQAPTSHYDPVYSVKDGNFENFATKYFYLQNEKFMVFFMCGKGHRCELRFKNSWIVNTNKSKLLSMIFKIKSDECKEFTIMQIHPDLTDRPLCRVVYMNNKFYIKIRKHPLENNYEMFYLSENIDEFSEIYLNVKNSLLKVGYNEKEIKYSVKEWENIPCYFKCGVYLQAEGCAKLLVDEIILKDY